MCRKELAHTGGEPFARVNLLNREKQRTTDMYGKRVKPDPGKTFET